MLFPYITNRVYVLYNISNKNLYYNYYNIKFLLLFYYFCFRFKLFYYKISNLYLIYGTPYFDYSSAIFERIYDIVYVLKVFFKFYYANLLNAFNIT